MTQINQNYENHSRRAVQQPVRMAAAQPQVYIPDYYMVDEKESFLDSLKSNPLYMVADGFFGPFFRHPISSILTWFGCIFALNKYTEACGGEYDKSLLKKIVNFGDNIENSKFIQSSPVQSVLKFCKSSSNAIGKFLNKSALIRAMKTTPSRPEWPMALHEMIPQRQRVVHDFNEVMSDLEILSTPEKNGKEAFATLNKLAVSNSEEEMLKRVFNVSKISDIPEAKASSQIQLSRLGISQAEIDKIISQEDHGVRGTKQAILDALGLNKEQIKAIKEDTMGNYTNLVQEATGKVGSKVRVGKAKAAPFGINLGFLTKPGERTLGLDYIHNRLRSLSTNVKEGAKTATGRFMAKLVQGIHRGLTFGGGHYGVLIFIAPALVETAINVHKADKNEKVGTCVSNLVNHISWVFTFPLGLALMHHIGGAQYAGKCKAKEKDYETKNAIEVNKTVVEERRNIIRNFNESNKKGEFKTLAEYNEAKEIASKELKKLKLTTKNPITWVTKQLARLMTIDLERFDGYNTGNFITTKLSKLRNLPRNLFGIPLRLVLFGLITMGLIDGALNKIIKAIFGRSYNAEKFEGQKEDKKEQKKFLKEDLNDRLYEMQKAKQMNAMRVRQPKIPKNQTANMSHRAQSPYSNIIPQVEEQENNKDNYSYIPSEQNIIAQKQNINDSKGKLDNYTYIPSQDSKLPSNNDKNQNTRSYIPSQKAANIQKSFNNSGMQSILDKADRAENRALKVLAGNFEGL